MASQVETVVNVKGTIIRVRFRSHANSLLGQRAAIKSEYKRAHDVTLTEEQADFAFEDARIW